MKETPISVRRSRLLDMAILIAFFAGAWALRATAANAFVTWDEPAWVFRSVKFLRALSRGEFSQTLLVGHPGVTTMWGGAASLWWHRLVTGAVTQSQLARVDAWSSFQVHDAALLRDLTLLLPYAKGGLLIAQAAMVAGAYGLSRALLARRYAVVIALVLALEPYYLALSRVLHIDALVSGLMLLTLLSLLVYVKRNSARWLLLAGALLGLAVLTKVYGLLTAPAGLALLAYSRWSTHRRDSARATRFLNRSFLSALLRDVLIGGLAAGLTFALLWPAVWVSPWQVVRTMAGLSLEYATAPGEATSLFYMGQADAQPGASFYLVALLFRAAPLTLLGAALGVLWAVLPGRITGTRAEQRLATLTLLGFAVSYLLLLTMAEKKYDRYVLPALLALGAMSALGLVGACELALRHVRVGRRIPMALAASVLVALAQAALLLAPLFPAHYLAYYSPLVGGLSGAKRALPVGWGEGLEQTASYLAAQPDAENLTVASWGVAGLVGGFPGHVVAPTEEGVPTADYVALYVSDVQHGNPLVTRYHGVREPVHVAHVAGQAYAWLYRSDHAADVQRIIVAEARPGDAVVTDLATPYARGGDWDLPVLHVQGETESEIAQSLETFRTAHGLTTGGRVYLVRYRTRGSERIWLERQLAQNGLYLWEQPFDLGVVRCYQLVEGAAFRRIEAEPDGSAIFDDVLQLWGHGLASPEVAYRQRIGVALGFRALTPIEQDLHVFVHLVDQAGAKWGQRDGPLLDEALRRTSEWAPGSERQVNLAVPLAPGVVPGEYTLVMGIYRIEDLTRLEARSQRGGAVRVLPGDEVVLATVRVASAPVPPGDAELEIPERIDAQLGAHTELLGLALSSDVWSPGDEVELTLWWRCRKPLAQDLDLVVHLVQGGTATPLLRAKPAGAEYPRDRWIEGEVLRRAHRLAVPMQAPSGIYDLRIGLAGGESGAQGDVIATQVRIASPERLREAPEIAAPMRAKLGQAIAFLGYAFERRALKAGEAVELTLYWRAEQRPGAAYTVFTHLLAPDGSVHSQVDAQPVGGERPTRGWAPGEYLVDHYTLPVAPDAQPGEYVLEVGMYDAATGARLPVTDDAGRAVPEQRILLDRSLTVSAP